MTGTGEDTRNARGKHSHYQAEAGTASFRLSASGILHAHSAKAGCRSTLVYRDAAACSAPRSLSLFPAHGQHT